MSTDPRIESIEHLDGFRLRVGWVGGTFDEVDLDGLMHHARAFRPLRDTTEFAKAKVGEYGWSVEWPNDLEWGADNLWTLARAAEPMTGTEFRAWQEEMKLSNASTADVLGVSVATVKNYRNSDELPHMVKLATRVLADDPAVLCAKLKPHVRGRPPKSTTGRAA